MSDNSPALYIATRIAPEYKAFATSERIRQFERAAAGIFHHESRSPTLVAIDYTVIVAVPFIAWMQSASPAGASGTLSPDAHMLLYFFLVSAFFLTIRRLHRRPGSWFVASLSTDGRFTDRNGKERVATAPIIKILERYTALSKEEIPPMRFELRLFRPASFWLKPELVALWMCDTDPQLTKASEWLLAAFVKDDPVERVLRRYR